MHPIFPAAGLAAFAAAGLAFAQDPTTPPAAPMPTNPAPVASPAVTEAPPVRTTGPVVIVDGVTIPTGPELIYRGRTPGSGSSNVIVGSGNGFGNSIVVDGAGDGVTVVRNSRNGYGNRIVVGNGLQWLDVPAFGGFGGAAAKAPPVYHGKATKFWAERAWSDAHDCYLYWSAKHEAWFQYHRADDTYRVVTADAPPAPAAQVGTTTP